MPAPLLATKLYAPPLRPSTVPRPHLADRLNECLAADQRLALVSAPAGFGKTTLVSQWAASCGRPVAWLSLDEGDSDPSRFLAYLIAALQTVGPGIGRDAMAALGLPQPPPPEATLTTVLNEVAALENVVVLVLDDYHLIDSGVVDGALAFLVDHLPRQLRLVIATREDPALPLARLRARGQLTEVRDAQLRFTHDETAVFLNNVMGLGLSADQVALLDARTEGWVVGLQLAAISVRGRADAADFIDSFAASHRFVLDYLVEEVLRGQPEPIQAFLLRTSILDRLCAPLCDAVIPDASASGQEILAYLERSNLFLVPLDGERRWFRYHHLFAELLRQRRGEVGACSSSVDEDHLRASAWFEANGFEIEAFEHAAAGHDIDRAERLMEGHGMPLHFRGALAPVLRWLASLPETVLDARPSLGVHYASVLLSAGRTTGIEPKLRAAERALRDAEPDARTRDLVGRIANVRAMVALTQGQVDTIITESRRALAYLDPGNLPARTFTNATLGYAYRMRGDRVAAREAYAEATSSGHESGNTVAEIFAAIGLGAMQEADNELHLAAETYQHVLDTAAGLPFPVISEAHLGLARIHCQWNDLDAAEQAWQQSAGLARSLENTDRPVACQVFLARLRLAQGDAGSAAEILAEADRSARRGSLALLMPEIAAAQVLTALRRGEVAAAARIVAQHDLPLCKARVLLAQGEVGTALAVVESYRHQVEERSWADERLGAIVLQAVAHQAHGQAEQAGRVLDEALALAEPEGFVRIFVDEGAPMDRLLREALARGVARDYVCRLLAAFPGTAGAHSATVAAAGADLAEPLSARELEVLPLIADGLTNQEIATRLYLSLHTVKSHARSIYAKLGVGSRTQAAARGRALGLLPPDRGPDA